MTRSSRSATDADGSSSVGTVFGVAIFLGMLLLSSQVLLHLYATSVVTAVAFDTARQASGDGGNCPAAREIARARLGDWGRLAEVEVACRSVVGGRTEVEISGPSPARALAIFGPGVVRDIDRGASFRTEAPPGEDGAGDAG